MSPIPPRFAVTEPLPAAVAASLPSSLRVVSKPIYYKALIIRLLVGTLDFECLRTGIVVKSRSDYSNLGIRVNGGVYKKTIKAGIPAGLDRFDRLTKRTLNYNFALYKDLFFELCSYLHARSQENELQAFVHLYRVLERISYCLPLLWAAKSPDHKKSFDTLKGYFNDPKAGELRVLKRFVEDFVDKAERETHATFNISSVHANWKKSYYTTYFTLIQDSEHFVSATDPDQFVIKFSGILDLMITCRNRYFHSLTGNSQFFNGDEVPDANEFFGIVNENAANWLAFLLFRVFENELERI